MDPFSPAQIAGYGALVLGVSAFLQKSDRRLMALNSAQSLAYAVHYFLMGNLPACGSSLFSSIRSAAAIRTHSARLALALVLLNLGMGAYIARGLLGWLPVAGSCIATVAMFTLYGIRLRLVLLCCTAMWLTMNVATGSIGGTVLESFIALANLSTIVRMLRARRRAP